MTQDCSYTAELANRKGTAKPSITLLLLKKEGELDLVTFLKLLKNSKPKNF